MSIPTIEKSLSSGSSRRPEVPGDSRDDDGWFLRVHHCWAAGFATGLSSGSAGLLLPSAGGAGFPLK